MLQRCLLGGLAANAAVAYSALNTGAFFVSSVGVNNFIEKDLLDNNLQFTDLSEEKFTQPVIASVVTSENGDRNILTHHPENICSDRIPKQTLGEVDPEIILLDGFYPEFSIPLEREAKDRFL